MICCNCDNDLAKCVCPDLRERFESILKSPYLKVGHAYEMAVREQIARNEKSGPETTKTE